MWPKFLGSSVRPGVTHGLDHTKTVRSFCRSISPTAATYLVDGFRSDMPAAAIQGDDEIVLVCETFVAATRNFFSRNSPYARAEALGAKGARLDHAHREQLRLFSYIEVLGRHICAATPKGAAGLAAKQRAASSFPHEREYYDLDIADQLDMSCANDQRRLSNSAPSPATAYPPRWRLWLDRVSSGEEV